MTFWRKISLLGLGLSVCSVLAIVLYYPSLTKATAAITFNSITPDATPIDMSSSDAPEGVQIFGFTGTPGESYDLEFTSSESPAVVVGINADMTTDQNWSYDPDTGLILVHVEYTGNGSSSLQATSSSNENANSNGNHNGNTNENSNGNKNDNQNSNSNEDHASEKDSVFILAFTFAVPQGEDGPPTEMTGSWFTTDVQNWQLIPPSPELPAFGYELSGSAGTKGYFHMFIPDTMIALLGQMSGKELTVSDLAVFNGDAQSSLAVDAVTGGALVNINVLFKEDLNTVKHDLSSSKDSSSLITKTITVQEQLPFSLTASLSSIKKGKAAQLYGWVNNGTPKTTVKIWRKFTADSDYTLWKKLKLKKNGYFMKKFQAKTTATYQATYQDLTSPEQIITVK